MTFTLHLFHLGQLILKVFLNLLLCVYDMLFVCWGAHAAMYVWRAEGGSQLIPFVWVLRPKLRLHLLSPVTSPYLNLNA